MENALLDLIDVMIVFAIGFGITMMALPPAYGGAERRNLIATICVLVARPVL
jgi:hypothetical protein